jgi:hypothetical protein
VPQSVLDALNADLGDENREARWVSSLGVRRTFVYLDVSSFSSFKPGQQSLVINGLLSLIGKKELWPDFLERLRNDFEAMLCIGDGYIFVFRNAVRGTYFAAWLAHLIELQSANDQLPVEFHFRMGVHAGHVYTFWDPGRRDWNYIGEGINGGQRVLGVIDKKYDDVIYVSDRVRKIIRKSRDADEEGFKDENNVLSHLANRGRQLDKHGNAWRVYELNHTAFCQGFEWVLAKSSE